MKKQRLQSCFVRSHQRTQPGLTLLARAGAQLKPALHNAEQTWLAVLQNAIQCCSRLDATQTSAVLAHQRKSSCIQPDWSLRVAIQHQIWQFNEVACQD